MENPHRFNNDCMCRCCNEFPKIIKDFPDYMIYPDGRVFSIKSNKFLKFGIKYGYSHVQLYGDGKMKNMRVHRLVGIHYIPNPENKRYIDHINRDTSDNRLENLRWATPSENEKNKGMNKNNKTGHKNISYDKFQERYKYSKTIDGKKIQKYFKTLTDALCFKFIHLLMTKTKVPNT